MLYRHRLYTVDEDFKLLKNRKRHFTAAPCTVKQHSVKLPPLNKSVLGASILKEGLRHVSAERDRVSMSFSHDLNLNLTLVSSFNESDLTVIRKQTESCEPRIGSKYRNGLVINRLQPEGYGDKSELQSPARNMYIKDNEIQDFIEAIFTIKSNKYRKNPKTQVNNLDINRAEALLKEANQIAKIGIAHKKAIDSSSFKKQNWEIEHFWYKHIGEDNVVRWDQFEENFLAFVESFMIIDKGFIRKINWDVLLELLYESLAEAEESYKLWPRGPTVLNPPSYQGKLVSLYSWIQLVTQSLFKSLISDSIQNSAFYISQLHTAKTYTYKCSSVYKGEWNKNVREGQGNLKLQSGDEYSGNFLKGRRTGFGIMKSMNYIYTGEWERDKMHGYGKLNYPDGTVFQGKFENNQPVNGTYRFIDGSKYLGTILNGQYDQEGTLETEGKVCRGKWKNGKMHGDGKVEYSDGKMIIGNFEHGEVLIGKLVSPEYSYKGEFRDLEPNGTGVLKFNDGTFLSGKFYNGKINGIGSIQHVNGDYYEGEFEDGYKNGIGKMTFTDGRVYEGSWIENKISGKGTLLYPPKSIEVKYTGFFDDLVFEGDGRIEYADGSFYEGRWLRGVKTGDGVWKTQNEIYTGTFRNNRLHGYGKLNFVNTAYYYGSFENGIPQGRGELMDSNGVCYDGMFSKGQPIKKQNFAKSLMESLNKDFDI